MNEESNTKYLLKWMKRIAALFTICCLLAAGCKDPVDDIDPQIDTVETSSAFAFGESLGTVEFNDLDEASGLANSRSNPDFFWSHNDSGGDPIFYLLSRAGADSGRYELEGIQNVDWEDMAIGVGPDDNLTYLYAADIGDNQAIRGNLSIHRTPEPDVSIRFRTVGTGASQRQVQIDLPADTTLGNIETIDFVYEDGARDAEALMVDPSTKDIFIVSKREPSVILYRLPYPQNTASMDTAERVSVLPFTQITAGDISPDGNEVILKNYLNVYRWVKTGSESIIELMATTPERLQYEREPQGEAIAWQADGQNYFTISETANNQPVVLFEYRRN